jgi:hypothetical protein
MQRNLVVKPSTRSTGSLHVLHGNGKLHPDALVSLPMEIHTACEADHVQFIPLSEAITCWNACEADHCPKILGQLHDCVGCQLVKLHSKRE